MDTQSSARPAVSIPPQSQPRVASEFHTPTQTSNQDQQQPQQTQPDISQYQDPTYQEPIQQNPANTQPQNQSFQAQPPDMTDPNQQIDPNTPEFFPNTARPQAEELIFSWEAPSRPFKKRSRQYYTTIIAIVFLISLILLFSRQFLPVAVVISVAFLAYVLAAVPPNKVTNAITTYGLRIDDQLYYWDDMGTFWFEQKYGQQMFHVETMMFPNRITFMMNDIEVEDMRAVLTEVLIEQKPADTFYDKAADWLQKNIPLEK